MRFWLNKNHEVPVREQLIRQVALGVLSSDLKPGERLPSVREMSRRWRVHANTISSAYQQLVEDGWLERRRGSGVYVRREAPEPADADRGLDRQIGELFARARQLRIPISSMRERLAHWLDFQPPERFVVIEPDEGLREIVVTEIRQAVKLPVMGCGLEDCAEPGALSGGIPVALTSKVAQVKKIMPKGYDLLELHVASIPTSLAAWMPARPDVLVGVASGWPEFLHSARTMLVAAGFSAEALVLRDARVRGWRRGLKETAAVVCDSVTAGLLPSECYAICFRLLAEKSLQELRQYEEFVTGE